MLYVATLFDPQKVDLPLYSAVYDPSTDPASLKFYPLYLPKTGKTIYDIELGCKIITGLIENTSEVYVNDCKRHLVGFKVNAINLGVIYDMPSLPLQEVPTIEVIKRYLVETIKSMRAIGREYWTLLRGRASPVYQYLQQRGILYGYERTNPIWHMDTYSGRTRVTGFAVQGLEQNAPIMNPYGQDLYLNFDWVAADMRIAAIMSGDEKLNYAFSVSDPYQYMADSVNDDVIGNGLTRAEAKTALFRPLYALDDEGPAMQFYDGLGSWMKRCKEELEASGVIKSILGRPFCVDEKNSRTTKSAFNAAIQGSVVHAMHASLRAVWELYPSNILTENQDSLVLTCHKNDNIVEIIKNVADIMCYPFRNILDSNPVCPVEVDIGAKYKNWRRYRRFG